MHRVPNAKTRVLSAVWPNPRVFEGTFPGTFDVFPMSNDRRPKLNDSELIQRARDGDSAALGELVRRYQDRLYNSMCKLLRDATEAEDVVQETWVLTVRKLHTFQGKSKFYTWLYRIARNVSATRRRRKRNVGSIDRAADEAPLQLPSNDPAPDERMRRSERVQQLYQALDRLSDEHREILVLREIDGLDYEEIAEVLGLPIGTVRSRLHRARGQLKEQLELINVDPE